MLICLGAWIVHIEYNAQRYLTNFHLHNHLGLLSTFLISVPNEISLWKKKSSTRNHNTLPLDHIIICYIDHSVLKRVLTFGRVFFALTPEPLAGPFWHPGNSLVGFSLALPWGRERTGKKSLVNTHKEKNRMVLEPWVSPNFWSLVFDPTSVEVICGSTQRSMTLRWPLTPLLQRLHVWLYSRTIMYKSHGDTSMYMDTVINFVKLTTYIQGVSERTVFTKKTKKKQHFYDIFILNL